MSARPEVDALAVLREGTAVDEALRQAWRDAVVLHKKLGQPMVVWKDGQVVWIPAEELDPDAESST